MFPNLFQELYLSPICLLQADPRPPAATADGGRGIDAPGAGAALARGCHAGVSAGVPSQAGDRERQQRHFGAMPDP